MNGKLSPETVPGICFSKVLKLFWPAQGATKVLGIFEKQALDENITLKRFSTLLKKPIQSNYSDQSKQQGTARLTNHNSQQLHITCPKRGKNRANKVRLVLVLVSHWLKTGTRFRPITKRSNRNRVITFDNHLKTALRRQIHPTCDQILRVFREGTIPHPSLINFFESLLEREVRCLPNVDCGVSRCCG